LVSVFSLTAGDFHQAFFLGCRIFKYDEVCNFLAKKWPNFAMTHKQSMDAGMQKTLVGLNLCNGHNLTPLDWNTVFPLRQIFFFEFVD